MSMKKILSIILIISILAISAPISAVNATNYGQFCNYTLNGQHIEFYDNECSIRTGVQEIIDSGSIWQRLGTSIWKMNMTGYHIASIERTENLNYSIGNTGVRWSVNLTGPTITNYPISIASYYNPWT
ncbi:MAG: hypothetical protein LBV42_05645 [Methanobrevibacter sp.]|jgi:hypothetical protein|nr:hypothetical protein [Methanobrevibacter sp.]